MKQQRTDRAMFLKFFMPYAGAIVLLFSVFAGLLLWNALFAEARIAELLQTAGSEVVSSALADFRHDRGIAWLVAITFAALGLVLSAFRAGKKSRAYGELLQKLGISPIKTLRGNVFQHILTGLASKSAEASQGMSAGQEREAVKNIADMPPKGEGWYYPAEMENALMESVLEADFDKVKQVLRQIKEDNFLNRQMTKEQSLELMKTLTASINRIAEFMPESTVFEPQGLSLYRFFEEMTAYFYEQCALRQSEPQTKGNKICREIQQYINNHYHDTNLSLYLLADMYKLNPSYLSTLFKKNVGCGLSSYLENVRISKAIEYMEKGERSIEKIADLVGFGNSLRLRRNFKKLKGVNPSDYIKG